MSNILLPGAAHAVFACPVETLLDTFAYRKDLLRSRKKPVIVLRAQGIPDGDKIEPKSSHRPLTADRIDSGVGLHRAIRPVYC